MKHPFSCIYVFLLFILLFASIVSADEMDGESLQEVTLQLKWKHQFQFAGYYAAIKEGYFAEAGLKVNFNELDQDTNVIDTVVKGEADFGIAISDLVRIRSQGIPVVALAVIYQHSPLALVASENSGIKELDQLAGKRVALETHSADIFAMLKTANLTKHLLKVTDHLFDPNDLLTDQTDAMSVYTTTEIFLFRQNNFKFRLFSPRNYGIDFYGDTLFTTEQMIAEQPDLVEKFREASLKGWEYALSNSEEMVNYIIEHYGDRRSREFLLFEAQNTMDLVQSDLVEVGYMHENRWKHIYEVYKSLDMIEGPVDFDTFIYKSEPDFSKFYNLIIMISIALLAITIVAIVYVFINKKLKLQIAESNILKKQLDDHAADLKRSNEALENFASIASHDLQEPLRKIIVFGDRIKETLSLADREGEYMNRMQSATRRMQTFIQDLLEFSKINSKPKNFYPTNLNKIVSDVLSDLETMIEKVEGVVEVENLPIILADGFQIRQLFLNLINNSVKFHKEETPPKVKIKSALTTDGFWKISIEDNGIGLDTKYAKRILKPFERLHGRGKFEGSGIGLAICDAIIKRHNGIIDVESSPNQGATFYIYLPQDKENTKSSRN